jgi:hypothetical protein
LKGGSVDKIVLDLRPTGTKKILGETWRLDLENVCDLKVGVNFILGNGVMNFPDYETMDKFIGQFTGHSNNISDKEMEKPSKIIK